jgi:TonB family protein
MLKNILILISFIIFSKSSFAQVDTNQTNSAAPNNNGSPSSNLDNDLIWEFVERMPEFPGGEDALSNFLAKNLKHPKNSEDGRVVVNFIVEKSGSLTRLKVIRKPEGGELLAEEVIRVVNKMPNWTPGSQNGKLVRVSFSLPISFHTH